MLQRLTVALVLVCVLSASSCEPVTPASPIDTRSFEGFTVHSAIPPNPVGIVYLFHGSGGSADFALKIETIDQTNALLERGYGWVATESTQRDGNKRWEVFDSSLATNPDLARLTRLHATLMALTDVNPDTPIFGIGMSNGARMVTLFAQSFVDAGYPVVAVAPFMGRAAPSVQAAGGLTVPGFWVSSVNDSTVATQSIVQDQEASAALGTATRLFIKPEEALLPIRFTRIPAVNSEEAEHIYRALLATGAWNEDGARILDLETTIERVLQAGMPATGATPSQVRNQVSALLALHQFVGLYRDNLADFFDEQLVLHNAYILKHARHPRESAP